MQQEAELKGLKVIELKSKLSKLGLDTKGRKDKLIERLLSHFESAKKETKAEDKTNAVVESHVPTDTVDPIAAADEVELKTRGDATGKRRLKKSDIEGRSGKRERLDRDGSKALNGVAKPKLGHKQWFDVLKKQATFQFEQAIVKEIYEEYLGGKDQLASRDSLATVEFSYYLEDYLLPHLSSDALTSPMYLCSLLCLLNYKHRNGIPTWDIFESKVGSLKEVAHASIVSCEKGILSQAETVLVIDFVSNIIESLEYPVVRGIAMDIISLELWNYITHDRLQLELSRNKSLGKKWKKLVKKCESNKSHNHFVTFLPWLAKYSSVWLLEFMKEPSESIAPLLESILRLYVTILSQLPTRRFFMVFLEDSGFSAKLQCSKVDTFFKSSNMSSWIRLFRSMMNFPVDSLTGVPLSEEALTDKHYQRVEAIQRLFFRHWTKLREFSLLSASKAFNDKGINRIFQELSDEEVIALTCDQLKLGSREDAVTWGKSYCKLLLKQHCIITIGRKLILTSMPLYPSESLFSDLRKYSFDQNAMHDEVLPLPKLNLQFLSLEDYLDRNFHLYRFETGYDIHNHISDVLNRIGPMVNEDGTIRLSGWSRMGEEISEFKITEVGSPALGSEFPSSVKADVFYNIERMKDDIKKEWDELGRYDVVFLVGFNREKAEEMLPGTALDALEDLLIVRGAEILDIFDEEGEPMNTINDNGIFHKGKGTARRLRVELDPVQYQQDCADGMNKIVYSCFKVVVRRSSKENNFKAVLKCIRDMLLTEGAAQDQLPHWLSSTLLGYGNPSTSIFTSLPEDCSLCIRSRSTFMDEAHLRECFPHHRIQLLEGAKPPFLLKFGSHSSLSAISKEFDSEKTDASITVESDIFDRENCVSFEDKPVKFTKVQATAIISALQPGMTTIVGPPGTGKTDTAVQILDLLYHNYPNQRTLIITHSNQALNDIFQKLYGKRTIKHRHLLRLGSGESELQTEETFSKLGRVNDMLELRINLLQEISKLAKSLGVAGENMSCESCYYFWRVHILQPWEKFTANTSAAPSASVLKEMFPFSEYFDGISGSMPTNNIEEAKEYAKECFEYLKNIFDDIEALRPFEILNSQKDRINYLLTKQAKIVAMTCTHAAMKRQEFLELDFTFDSIVMEEAGQILEVETLIPVTMQNLKNGGNPLKRIVLLGDHRQLPPVVKSSSLGKQCGLEQSMFARLIRLGVPYIQLHAQGRSRPGIASLFSWRYENLENLPMVYQQKEFLLANPGFAFEYQMVDVPEKIGRGEFAPQPYFYQNLDEAEYVVLLYQYMRLLGYKSNDITILTTYNGQCALIKDIVKQKCSSHPLFGTPTVMTVDKFQGNQNKFVLLSLVRTKRVGHLRDIRRLVVAVSRARLGLYIFGRCDLFSRCQELQPTFSKLLQRPTQLALVNGEHANMNLERRVDEVPPNSLLIQGIEQMADIVKNMDHEWKNMRS